MTNPLITIHDSTTDESITREMNAAEFQQYEANQAEAAAKQAEAEANAAAKAALLARLGITADEATLLLS